MKGNLTRRGKSKLALKVRRWPRSRDRRGITKFVTLRGSKTAAQAEAVKLDRRSRHRPVRGIPHRETVAEFVYPLAAGLGGRQCVEQDLRQLRTDSAHARHPAHRRHPHPAA